MDAAPEQHDTLIGALLGLSGLLIAAAREALARRPRRVAQLEQRVDALERLQEQYWLWSRALVDYAYRHGDGTPIPKPPEGIFTTTKENTDD